MKSILKCAPWAVLLLAAACTSPAAPAKLPEGETDLSCAASIFAATNLLDDKGLSSEEMGLGNYVAVMTTYGTAYAKSEGIGADESLAKIKLAAYRAKDSTSSATIVSRAKACAGRP